MTWLKRRRMYCAATHAVEDPSYGYRHRAGCMRRRGHWGRHRDAMGRWWR